MLVCRYWLSWKALFVEPDCAEVQQLESTDPSRYELA
jgi:hypothetical protein